MKKTAFSKAENGVKKAARLFNEIAGWAVVAAMVLVVANVILRTVFKSPILGTYEYTGFITAIIVGCGIAFCLLVDAHISIDFIVQKLPYHTQKIISAVTNTVMFAVMSIFTFNIFKYAVKLVKSNSVSPTTQFPFYTVVFAIGICFTLLCLVLILKIKKNIEEVKKNES
jgi:TRAP-type C4-dicarboxylate transport system permease small subunit